LLELVLAGFAVTVHDGQDDEQGIRFDETLSVRARDRRATSPRKAGVLRRGCCVVRLRAAESPAPHPSPADAGAARPSDDLTNQSVLMVGYAFDLDQAKRLVPGLTLAEVCTVVRGEPVAILSRSGANEQAYLWYAESNDELCIIEACFVEGRFTRLAHAERVSGEATLTIHERYSPVHTWILFDEGSEPPTWTITERLLLQLRGEIRRGSRYNDRAHESLVSGQSTREECLRAAGGEPYWIAEYANGYEIVCWFQSTPSRGTSFEAAFDPAGVLAYMSISPLCAVANMPWVPSWGPRPAEECRGG
jgi:hypothetical protein